MEAEISFKKMKSGARVIQSYFGMKVSKYCHRVEIHMKGGDDLISYEDEEIAYKYSIERYYEDTSEKVIALYLYDGSLVFIPKVNINYILIGKREKWRDKEC